ncbi:MAG: hypothetical protein COT28_19085 [Methylobacterium sp. CG08_land_8_20_14_0_20_71_15]|nr:MAG: hypothetical protein COT56_22070 [Methylobacterium sp. CG09_land_8_20_14_0_10_71_15]PIU11666.1 MAG: hypothetical protein COT28_19085 [Methylobacterium sp. CG08_land_8_20_14_0_20_71_15]
MAPPASADRAVPAACTAFAWPLLRELAWFEAPGLPRKASGDTLPAEMPAAVLALKPTGEVAYPVPPSRPPAADSYGGILMLEAPPSAGIYQVTLSDEAWLDVSQDGRSGLSPVSHTGKRDCPGLRKSLRFQLGSGRVVIAISGAKSDSIRVAVAPAE